MGCWHTGWPFQPIQPSLCRHNGTCFIFTLSYNNYMKSPSGARSHAVMSTYHCRYIFKFQLHILALFSLQQRIVYTYLLLKSLQHGTLLADNICCKYKKATPGARFNENSKVSLILVYCLSYLIIAFGSAIFYCIRVIFILIQVLYQGHHLVISPVLPQICLILLSIL